MGLLLLLPLTTLAHEACPRPAPGSAVTPPPDLWSENGVLNVTFNYFTTVDAAGRTLFCFMTAEGLQGPTLHVLPGDTLNISVTNMVPAPPTWAPVPPQAEMVPMNRFVAETMAIRPPPPPPPVPFPAPPPAEIEPWPANV